MPEISRSYIKWLENLPCNRATCRRRRSGWVSDWSGQGFADLPAPTPEELKLLQFEAGLKRGDTEHGAIERLKRAAVQIFSGAR